MLVWAKKSRFGSYGYAASNIVATGKRFRCGGILCDICTNELALAVSSQM